MYQFHFLRVALNSALIKAPLPGTHCTMLATMVLKWARMSFSTSSSFSFSASSSMRVMSTYSRNKAPRARLSRSSAPLVLFQTNIPVCERHTVEEPLAPGGRQSREGRT